MHDAELASPEAPSHPHNVMPPSAAAGSSAGAVWMTTAPPAHNAAQWLDTAAIEGTELQSEGSRSVSGGGLEGRLAALHASARRDRSVTVQSVQWYPGHIARAERQLKEQLKQVDVVLEVRDARIPVATHHPQVSSCGAMPLSLFVFANYLTVTTRGNYAHMKHRLQRSR